MLKNYFINVSSFQKCLLSEIFWFFSCLLGCFPHGFVWPPNAWSVAPLSFSLSPPPIVPSFHRSCRSMKLSLGWHSPVSDVRAAKYNLLGPKMYISVDDIINAMFLGCCDIIMDKLQILPCQKIHQSTCVCVTLYNK